MREIVVDTETTGLNAETGDKIVEIGCVELRRGLPTGVEFHRYINPERDIPESARNIHGIDEKLVKDKPRFVEIADELKVFFAESRLVMHNAPFDLSFLNAELRACARAEIANPICDTLALAQERFRAERVSLDALCRRYGIDLAVRQRHGALTDARLLAKVYLELCGGRQQGMGFDSSATTATASRPSPQAGDAQSAEEPENAENAGIAGATRQQKERPPLRLLPASDEEKMAHRALLAKIEKLSRS